MTERAKNIIVLGVGCMILLCVWLFSSPNSELSNPPMETAEYYQPAPTPGNDLDVIEADSEIKIPTSAREIHALISGFRELDVWVSFDLPEEDLSTFLNGTLCKLPLTQVAPKNYAPDELDPDWWQPYTSKDLAECRGGNNTTRQNILVDSTNLEILKIYAFSWTDYFATHTPSE